MNNNYLEIKIDHVSNEVAEIIIAQLSDLGFSGFEESENMLLAFIDETAFNENEVAEIFTSKQLNFSKKVLAQRNWNDEWEKNFDPVTVDDFVTIRAHFHETAKNVAHEIIITPKMSFGTGHHATTYLMMQQMRTLNFEDKSVVDFGTGTGVLAILAEKLGASAIQAIDNDDWSIANAQENIERNSCKRISVRLSGMLEFNKKFDLILANINKNVILEHFKVLANSIVQNGQLLLSGLLQEDEADILFAASALHLKHKETIARQKWICIHFTN